MIRLMIIDDSLLARKALERVLSADPEIQIVDTAINGKDALAKMDSAKPQVVTCDMEMPEMDGVQTLMALRKHYPEVRVVILSSLTQEDSPQKALCRNLGAHAVLAKPTENSDIGAARNGAEILDTIKKLA